MVKKNANTVKAVIKNAPQELAEMLREFTVIGSYETRHRSTGKNSLYIRMTRPQPTISCEK